MTAPALIAALATAALEVSTEMGTDTDFGECRDDRNESTLFFLFVDWEPTPGLVDSAPMSNMSAPSSTKRTSMRHRQFRIIKTPAVEERIRRHVDDAHHQGAIEGKTLFFELELHCCSDHVFTTRRNCIPVGNQDTIAVS